MSRNTALQSLQHTVVDSGSSGHASSEGSSTPRESTPPEEAELARSTIRRAVVPLVVALVAATGVAVTSVPTGAAPVAVTPADGSTAAWLADKVGADGLVPAMGYGSLDNTAQTVIALASIGQHRDAAERATDALEAQVEDYVVATVGGITGDQPGRIARLILIAVLMDRDPTDFGGVDLPARLAGTRQGAGPDEGLYGPADIYNSAFNQGMALLALSAIGQSDPGAAAWLVDQQCADGSWMGYRADTSQPCAFDPMTFAGPEANGTSMAVVGLVAQGTSPAVDPVAWFESLQAADGGFPYAAGSDPDPNSTALVIDALLALGVDPASGTFASGTPSPIEALDAFRFDCEADEADRGAYWITPFDPADPIAANFLATVQALPAAAGRGLLVTGPAEWGTAAADECALPTTTSTSTPTTTAPGPVPSADDPSAGGLQGRPIAFAG